MIVVSDTSPISNLVALGKLAWLETLFGQVAISQEVYRELTQDEIAISGAQVAIDAGWLTIHAVHDRAAVDRLRHDIGFWISDSVYQYVLGLAEE